MPAWNKREEGERKRRSVGEFQQGREILDHLGLSHAPERYGVAGGPGGPPERADQLPDGALQDPRQGPPLPSGAHDAGGPAPAPARLPEEQGREALSRSDRQARNPQVGPRDRPRPTLASAPKAGAGRSGGPQDRTGPCSHRTP